MIFWLSPALVRAQEKTVMVPELLIPQRQWTYLPCLHASAGAKGGTNAQNMGKAPYLYNQAARDYFNY